MTVSKPVVAASQNGPGTADTEATYFDAYAQPVWTKDGGGFLGYDAYDPATGAVVKTIADVDTTQTSDFSGLPSGWSTPTGGGLHLVTQVQVDGLGRPTAVTDPAGKVSYSVYNDPGHEVRSYRGWDATAHLPTGPTLLIREDRPGAYVESLTMTATPHLTSNLPDGAESVAALQSLSRTYANSAGQPVSRDDYVSLTGLTYGTGTHPGTLDTNYV